MEQLADFVAAFLKLYSGPLQFNIRLHPGYEIGTSHYDSRFYGDARVKLWPGNSRPDTFEMIAMSDLHLSVSSACHYEALGIGTPTGILALPGHELVLDLVRRNDAALVDNPSALAMMVKNRSWPTVSSQRFGPIFPSRPYREHAGASCRMRRHGEDQVITIVDYGTSNLGSMQNMLKKIGAASRIAASPDDLDGATKIIVPGVGSFDAGMGKLRESGMIPVLNEKALVDEIPTLGVCLGMQLMTAEQ